MGFRAMCVWILVAVFGAEAVSQEKEPAHPVDVAEKFVHSARLQQFESAAALSTSDQQRIKDNEMVQRMLEDARKQVYWLGADFCIEGDRAAVLFVRSPRDKTKERSVEAVNLVRAGGSWKVELVRSSSSTRAPRNEPAQKLRDRVDHRTKEILSIVNAKTLPSYPLSGMWVTHYRQTDLILILSSDGQAIIITIQPGSHGRDIYDYHIQDGTIVIEARGAPIRLKRDKEQRLEKEGQIYDYLIAESPGMMKALFPYETIRLKPATRATPVIHRPASVFNDRRRSRGGRG